MAKVKTAQPVAQVAHDDYAAQDDARTLTRAEEIRADKPRHKAARTHLKRQHAATARALGNPIAAAMKD